MQATLIKFKDTVPAKRFATTNNIFADRWYKISYQDGENYVIDDGGVLQEIPMGLVETKTVRGNINEGVANNRLLLG